MQRIASALLLAAAIGSASGQSLADEALVTEPLVDFKLCSHPAYPKSALNKEEEGFVILGVRVGADGFVLETKVLLSTGTRALDEATDAAYRKCRYAPGKVNGQPAAMWTVIHYVWTLDPTNGKLVTGLAKAALAGDAGSRYLLGAFLSTQAKTEAERNTALELEVSAAEAGAPMAQVALGGIYEKGTLVPRDMDEARRWLRLAAAQGNVYAIDHLRFIDASK